MEDYKIVLGKLSRLCQQKWPDEFPAKYIGTQAGFRDWLNEKTGLSVDHTVNKEASIRAWVESLEAMP